MANDDRIRVMLADDHVVFRRGMRELLEEDQHVEIVGEAATGDQAIEQARRYQPDVVVMDVRMPDKDGIQATREIKAELPHTEVVMVSAVDDDEQVFQALQAGASGYLIKDDDPGAMIRAILNASEGKLYLGPAIAKRVMERLSREQADHHQRAGRNELTPRETVVLRQIADGRRNREIATSLGISERTVGNHIANIFSKLHVQDRAQAILHAVRKGIIRV